MALNPSILNKYDPSGMHKIYDRWPELARESYESKIDAVDYQFIDHIVFAGMGGSGAISDIFASILSKTDVHVSVIKGYVLPKTVDSHTLVVATSVSGNTLETLSILDSAYKKDCKRIAFSSGGRMQEYCAENKIEHRRFQQIHSPRTSFPIFLYGILKALGSIVPIKKDDVLHSIRFLGELQKKINSSNLDNKNPALDIATWISGIPLIYYPSGLQASAIRFKNSLHENAKSQVFLEEISEACHNEIVSWERPANVRPVLIQGQDDHITTKEKWQILREYFETKGIEYKEVFSVPGNILTKLINLIYLLDYSTIYLAVTSGVDPSPVLPIDFVKQRQHIHSVKVVRHNFQDRSLE
ncbi:MAG: glucose-6-phosphate isomerase [Thaumarchaeota archaeon 13_1_40CM_38_12]|nr:MAG: glucose-6-phosphate isomerase [Thaumarchaeota archaeon 13_1_40CM_38_12]OLD40717.1 MAG: glucose-6-phosphate isomerase [Thaumarchaeota archaeon 13_1_40CM_2_39_4]OLE39991.1 MAG: glucose-6-phosphate isomerase [Thaumarchaeota archaeon 13_1_20CM_2_38_5]